MAKPTIKCDCCGADTYTPIIKHHFGDNYPPISYKVEILCIACNNWANRIYKQRPVDWYNLKKCPDCGGSLLSDGNHVWCSFVECSYGIDPPVRLLTY